MLEKKPCEDALVTAQPSRTCPLPSRSSKAFTELSLLEADFEHNLLRKANDTFSRQIKFEERKTDLALYNMPTARQTSMEWTVTERAESGSQ